MDELIKTDGEFYSIINNFLKEVKDVNVLEQDDRMLSRLAVLVGIQGLSIYKEVLKESLDIGINPVMIKELLYQASAYLGISRTHDYIIETNKIMKEYGIELPLDNQSNTNLNNRFEKGLSKQISLFGEGMSKRQEDKWA